jgi:two-component system, cell cycle sensor histidine kinase and response regulator CckA
MPDHVRILLLEDSQLDAELAERHLIRGGIEPILVRVSREADFRAEVESGNHELILADYHLPDFDGMRALEIVRELAPETPFIFMSGSLGEERAVEALKNGADDYIIKDRPSRLGAAIRAALDKKREAAERIQTERRIRDLSRINQMILSHAAEGIMAVSHSGALIFANPAAAMMLGWTDSAEITDLHGVLHPGEEDESSCPLIRDMRSQSSRAGEAVFTTSSGQRLDVRYTAAPVLENGQRECSVLTFADITAQKRLERQLEQAYRVSGLGRVAATIAHEFNNVLMGIQPFTEVIRRRTDDEKILRAATQIATSVTRGKRVTEEILRFTQPAEPSLQEITLGDWLRSLLPELKSLAGRNVEIAMQLPERPVAIRTDPEQLQQVVTNLVLNARDAMSDGGRIVISVHDEESSGLGPSLEGLVLLEISDNGSGMQRDVLDHIFDPLFTTKRTGTGLGLAVAQQIIRRQGGSISAESTPGKGTTFHIVLPAVVPTNVHSIQAKEPRRATVSRVVLVEDEIAIATGLTMLLESEGVAVRAVELGGEAMSAIETFHPDAVILDLSLPDMDGAAVMRLISDAWPNLPVLLSSGHGDLSTIEQYFATGRVAFLRKPYELDELLEALEKVAAQPAKESA